MDWKEQKQKQLISQQVRKENHEEAREEVRKEAPQKTGEEVREETREKAQQQIQQQLQHTLPPAAATGVANGQAVQQQAPARQTYKERRAEKRHAREARENTDGVGNIVTYDIKHQLEDHKKQHTNSLNSYFPFIGKDRDMSKNRSDVDMRVLRGFSHGFRTDKKGNPATPDDLKYQLEDAAFFDAFCSTENERRTPYLQRMMEELLSCDLKEDLLSDNSLRSNAAGIYSLADHLVYMENVVDEKHKNTDFFFKGLLSSGKREALKQVQEMFVLGPALVSACQKRGVEADNLDVPYINSKEKIATYSMGAEGYADIYQDALKKYQTRKDTFKQAAERPDPGVYHKIRSLLETDVQKVLACDVESLRALSDKELRQRREELNGLYTASLNVGKCLTLKHPDQTDGFNRPITLQDDLIGQRGLEYEYKSDVLRGLAEKAAGFKRPGEKRIKAASERYRKQMTPGTDEFQEFFDKLLGPDLVSFGAHPPKFDAVTREFEEAVNLPKEFREGKVDEAGLSEEERRKREIAKAMFRLQGGNYFSLEYNEAQLKDMKKPSTIGEALFRSFHGFLKYEAVQTLLTPEQFERMLFDLGAGSDLTPDSDAGLREEAVKRNNAGVDTLREVLTAQYDMLERKYGNSIEKLTIQDLMEHYLEIGRDISNTQEDFHMAVNFPGFIRENNKDDERLYHRIQYYNRCGIAISGLVPLIASGTIPDPFGTDMMKISNESIHKYLHAIVLEDDDSATAEDYLMKNGSSFQHPLDWTQKVKNPAETK